MVFKKVFWILNFICDINVENIMGNNLNLILRFIHRTVNIAPTIRLS